MKKIFGIKLLAAVLIIAGLASDSLAQTRIRFARGRTSATVTGSLAAGASRKYAMRVADGQSITISVDSGNNSIKIDADDVHGHIDYGDGYLEYTSDDNGDQWITLINEGDYATRYTMTVSARW
ncbi:MAG: hypothetical protein JSS81_19905 [Acidobacteria bacterium]|nr:hypothetical protein [Acidobacteriota bacterium]